MRVVACVGLLLFFVGLTFTHSVAQDKPVYVPSATNKFGGLPVIPACTTVAGLSGDPSKGAAVLQLRSTSGCVIPWHWHTSNENLMFVSGTAQVAMKDGAPATLHPGDYLAMPSKHVHEFTCVASCKLFLAIDSAFDIHYVDASGKEISMDEALKPKAKQPAKATPKRDDMKM
jgi:quercetin dioxygenase-like cupin family protein